MSAPFTPVIRPAMFPCDGTTPPLSDIIVFTEPPPGMAGEPYRWAGLGRNPGGVGQFEFPEEFPAGLSIDPDTGIVSGTPSVYFDADVIIGLRIDATPSDLTRTKTVHFLIND